MPVTYTNRKGVTYTLYRKIGADGKPLYAFGRKHVGEPVDELPPGFRISESPNGIVSLARDTPALIHPEEIAAVEAQIQRHPQAKNYRITSKHKRIEIYAKVGPDVVAVYHVMLAEGLVLPGREKQMQEVDELVSQFRPVLCFTLLDRARRTFRAERLISLRGGDEWVDLGQTGDIAELARVLVPPLGADAFSPYYEFFNPNTAVGSPAMSAGKRGRSRVTTVHRLKVTLRGSRPPIWRRILVPSGITLAELHDIIQDIMGWNDSHLHDFQIGDESYGNPRMVDDLDGDERTTRLAAVAPRAKDHFRYMYDFGDSWDHEILVEAVSPPEPGMRYPICLKGKRASPPEDSGGIWRYGYLVHLIADPTNPDPVAVRGVSGMAGRSVRSRGVRSGGGQQAVGTVGLTLAKLLPLAPGHAFRC